MMGCVNLHSISDPNKIIYSGLLTDSSDRDDELSGFLPGDFFELTLDVDQTTAKILLEKNQAGINVRERFSNRDVEAGRYAVMIDFIVLHRKHNIARDWMSEYKMGFRSTGTTIFIQAATIDGERLFIDLQKDFDDQMSKQIFGEPIVS